ncbi:MAG TPA: hypothetical protein VF113_12985 [Stellaceae bacterium]
MTMTAEELAIVRRAYAKQVLAAARVRDERVEAAFAAVPREDFLGPGPWPIYRFWDAYVATPSADPVYLYTNDLVGILPARHLNNGQPSLHAHHRRRVPSHQCRADGAPRRGLRHHAPRNELRSTMGVAGRHLPLRGHARRGVRVCAGGGARQGRVEARDPALS